MSTITVTLDVVSAALANATTLDDLQTILNGPATDLAPDDRINLDITGLPAFGGEPPADPQGVWSWVWSWDHTRLLVGVCAPFAIVAREG